MYTAYVSLCAGLDDGNKLHEICKYGLYHIHACTSDVVESMYNTRVIVSVYLFKVDGM